MKADTIKVGDKLTFTKKPIGSYISNGETMIVESRYGSTVHLRNPITGGATYVSIRDILLLSQFTQA